MVWVKLPKRKPRELALGVPRVSCSAASHWVDRWVYQRSALAIAYAALVAGT